MLQGVASLQVEDTPIRGLSKSWSVSPIALYIARCGALSGPSSVFLLSSSIIIIEIGAYNKIFQLLKSGRYFNSVNPFHLENCLAHAAFCIAARKILGKHLFVQVIALGAAERERHVKGIELKNFSHLFNLCKIPIFGLYNNSYALIAKNKQPTNLQTS